MKIFTKKSLLLSATAIAALSAFGVWSVADPADTRPLQLSAMQKADSTDDDGELPKFYGSLEWTDAWGELGTSVYNYGIYSFTIDGGEPYWESGATVPHTNGGGFYLDEVYYGISGSSSSQKAMNTFYKYDATSWKYLESFYYEAPGSLTYSSAMVHDYTTGKTYAVGLNFNDPTVNLREVDLTDGSMKNIAQLSQSFGAMACDANGQLYGFHRESAFPYPVSLYKINKTNGECTFVGQLGVNQKASYSAACFDTRNNKLYFTTELIDAYNQYYEETYGSYLMEINTATGEATKVKKFAYDNVQFSSLYIMDSHPKAPEAVKNLNFQYASGEYAKGKISCQLPTEAYDRTVLSGTLKVEVYVDSVKTYTQSGLAPGATYTTSDLTLDEGKHTVWVYCYNSDELKSTRSEISFYGGQDVPEAVSNLQMTVTPDHKSATITWEAPQKGNNNGIFDASKLTYTVVRRPDNTTVASGLTECKFTDTPDRVQYLSQYAVYAETPAGQSPVRNTQTSIVGSSRSIPYLQTFDSSTEFYSMFALDPLNLAQEDGQYWMFQPDLRLAIYFLSYTNRIEVDGWLVTPSLTLKPDYIYRLSYQTQGFASGEGYKRTIDVHLGKYPTVEALDRQVDSHTFALIGNETAVPTILFTTKAGDEFVGFHAKGTAYDHVSLDNIRITEYGPASAPAAPELISVSNDNDRANVTVKLPTLDAAGNPVGRLTQLSLFGSDLLRPIATVDLTDGQTEATVSDATADFGVNTYFVSVANSSGYGLALEVDVDLRPDTPQSVQNLQVATANNGNDAVLTWEYPSNMLGANGRTLTEDQITYDVYRTVNFVTDLMASVSGKTTVSLTDVMADYPDERQKYITYNVVARTAGGEAKGVQAKGLFGQAFEMPIHEGFDYETDLKPWDTSRNTDCSFYTSYRGSNPSCDPTEGRVLTFSPSYDRVCTGLYVSPRINLTGFDNPTFSYSVYHAADSYMQGATVQIGVIAEKDGIEQDLVLLGTPVQVYSSTPGWQTYTVDLSAFSSYSRASVVIRCQNNVRGGNIHFDTIDLYGQKPQIDVRMISVDGPATVLMGRDNEYTATVANNGLSDLKNVKVAFYADGDEPIAATTVDIPVETEVGVEFAYRPGLNETPRNLALRAEATVEGDANLYNNTAQIRVNIEAPNLPYVTDLSATILSEGVQLTWSDAEYYPDEHPVTDNFESYENFIIDNIGEWTLYDRDQSLTFPGLSDGTYTYTWTNIGMPQAYMVFNPKQVGIGAYWSGHSGDKFLVSFGGSTDKDDWLVSPPLSGHEQTISFFAAAFMSGYPEVYDVMVSSSGNAPDDFTVLRSNVRITSTAWREQNYTLPAGTRYFAIVCRSDAESFGLMIDDISYVPIQPSVELTGYNVYRDSSLYASGLGETEYLDTDYVPTDVRTYNVTATYTEGESIFSNDAVAVPAGVVAVAADSQCTITTVPGHIIVKSPAGTPLTVHTVDGRCLYSFASTGDENLSVVPGIYIVRAGTTTAKLIVR